jgi:hypothetical protein
MIFYFINDDCVVLLALFSTGTADFEGAAPFTTGFWRAMALFP